MPGPHFSGRFVQTYPLARGGFRITRGCHRELKESKYSRTAILEKIDYDLCVPHTLGLQVCKQYLLRGLKYINMIYFGLFGARRILCLLQEGCTLNLWEAHSNSSKIPGLFGVKRTAGRSPEDDVRSPTKAVVSRPGRRYLEPKSM